MITSLAELEQRIADEGFHSDNLLAFLRLLPTNDGGQITEAFNAYVAQIEGSGVDIDNAFVERVNQDLREHGRVQPETIIGAPPRPNIVLGEKL